MVTKEAIKADDRFYIDDWNLERITKRKIISYRVETIPVGNIWRLIEGKIIPLRETDVYKYLDGDEIARKKYEAYCNSELCQGNDARSVRAYESLISLLRSEMYDMERGAIFVDQLNIILEGQHRSCILLKEFGPDYRIPVVKVQYEGLYIRTRLKKIIAYIKYWRVN